MERLTKRTETGVAYLADPITLRSSMEDRGKVHTMIDRLAAYEDTDRTPDEIEKLKKKALSLEVYKAIGTTEHLRELVAAEQEGRLVVLPCKVGDYVYIPSIERQEVIRTRVQGISVAVSGRAILRFGGYPVESAWGDGCGKDWFLTREEAEKALRENGKDV